MRRCTPIAAVPASSLCALLLLAPPARGQTPDSAVGRVVGRILDDESGRPVPGVSVTLDGAGGSRVTDAQGNFLFPSVPRGIRELVVEHLGYGRVARLVNVPPGETVQVDLRLVPAAIALDSVVVQVTIRNPVMERGGYYDRKKAGWGYYLEGVDLRRASTTDILRGAPRVEVVTGQSVLDRRVRVVEVGPYGPQYCEPEIYIDGHFIRGGADMLDEIIQPTDIQAIEVYRGMDTPLQFFHEAVFKPCGAVLIWTKR
ncbi:MAG: carboxypeptidase-like regulatory domain-containing protein [Gemmatimonadetes bacterium]|nr:carboxypeptidase-like regulatory domain-containing protein [Gemmatimonadota bacterium]